MNERDLKEYIVKLNDRNIQRQRESGFTLYAIAAAIIYCVFFLIDNISIANTIYEPQNFNICVFTSNLLLILSFFYVAYLGSVNRTYVTKIFPYQQPFRFEIEDSLVLISFAMVAILNFLCLNFYEGQLHKVFLYTFGIIPVINIASPFVIKGYRYYKKFKKKREKQSTEIIDFTYKTQISKSLVIGLIIYAIILSMLFIYSWRKTIFYIEPDIAGGLIKFTICFYALLVLIKLAIEIHTKQNVNHLLEEFEKEIFFENIDNKEIAKKYELMFFGIPILKWFDNKQIEITNFFDSRRKDFLLESVRIVSLNDINDQEQHNLILKDVIEGQSEILRKSKDFVQMINNNFINLGEYASLDDDEAEKLSSIQVFLNQNIKSFNQEYFLLSKKIKKELNKYHSN